MTTIIYGSSDDLIEVDGDFYDEYDQAGCDKTDILVGIGRHQLKATIEFREDWTIKVYPDGVEYDYTVFPAGTKDAIDYSGKDYSDVLVIDDPVDFVAIGLVAAKK